MELLVNIIHLAMVVLAIWILWFLTAAKVWEEIGLPGVSDYYFYNRIQDKLNITYWGLAGRKSVVPGSGNAVTRKAKRNRKSH